MTPKNELFAALAKAQAEMPMAEMNGKNPFFKSKYSTLVDLIKASRPALTKNSLCVTNHLDTKEDGNFLVTVLGHGSGQEISSSMRINPAKSDVQAFGSFVAYAMRYNYKALVGVVCAEDDDDGEGTMLKHQKSTPSNKITKEQLEILEEELVGNYNLHDDIITKMKISKLADMPKIHFNGALRRIREIKSIK